LPLAPNLSAAAYAQLRSGSPDAFYRRRVHGDYRLAADASDVPYETALVDANELRESRRAALPQ
jgi:hypothetical protein